ncbi:MAG: FAD-dependent oxidoreductase [Bacteroidetes bacterium]|nr:FAD-dependent oxidoreductase [Bacteroidota bacterium]
MIAHYDHIVIGASLPGVIAAVKRAASGDSVLLTNACGFPGGSITELLNCAQRVDRSALSGITASVFDAVFPDSFGAGILNPESMKYALQHVLESSSVTPLFHVVPTAVTRDADGALGVQLLAKEGSIRITASGILDATEEHHAAALCGASRSIVQRSVHLFITPPVDDRFLTDPLIRSAVRLDDGRYWVTLAIATKDEYFQENEAHEAIDRFRLTLDKSGSRLQMLPLGIRTDYHGAAGAALPEGLLTIEKVIGRPLQPDALFTAAQQIEERS